MVLHVEIVVAVDGQLAEQEKDRVILMLYLSAVIRFLLLNKISRYLIKLPANIFCVTGR